MKKFTLFWLDGKREVVEGLDIADAFRRAGYGGGAAAAVDWYANGDVSTHHWNHQLRCWVPNKFNADMFGDELEPHCRGKVLTIEEVAQREKTIVEHTFVGEDQNVMFFSDNHLFGYPVLPSNCVPTTISLPYKIAPREGFEAGVVTADTFVQFTRQCSPGVRIIESLDELVDYLNSTIKES